MKKITDFKVVFICPDHNEKYNKRKIHTESLLKNIGFKDIEHFKSTTENYPDCLNKANVSILENNLDSPILIVEDDIEWTGIDTIEYDESVDAIYLGISKSGGHPIENKDQGSSKFEKWSSTQVLVKNMLTTHAILYISRKYKERVISILKQNIGLPNHTDVLLSRIQSEYHILANKMPVFYQSRHFGNVVHSENWTKFEIDI